MSQNPWISYRQVSEEAKPGDLLEFERNKFNHWAIYVGMDKNVPMVIHLANIDKVHKVEYAFLETVAGSKKCRINNQYDWKDLPLEPREILRRAHAKLDQTTYDKIEYNSEHFATYCRSGVPRSERSRYDYLSAWTSGDEIVHELYDGDLIEFEPRNIIGRHWAIYAGKEEGVSMVIHLWSRGKDPYMVRYDVLSKVAEGRNCRIKNYFDVCEKPYYSREILRRAHELLDNTKYNLLLSNCEHFVTFCRNGRKRCSQIPALYDVASSRTFSGVY